MGSVLLIILAVQAVCIVVVVLVLWVVLEKRLTNLAIKDFSFYAPAEGESKPAAIQIVTHKTASAVLRSELQKIVQKKFGANVQLVYQIDKNLMGGVIIKVNQRSYNYSLRERLKQSGFLKV